MKKALLSLSVLALCATANAKTLTVDCKGSQGETLQLVSDIANVNSPQVIQSLDIDGSSAYNPKDVSSMPIYQNGTFSLNIQFGPQRYDSVQIKVDQCSDEFLATGEAKLSTYVGGFAGTSLTRMQCTCSLK